MLDGRHPTEYEFDVERLEENLRSFDDVEAISRWGVFSTGDAALLLGVTRRKLLLYIEQKLVAKWLLKSPSRGRGHHRWLSLVDLYRIYIIVQLERFGIAPRYLKNVSDGIYEIGVERLRQGRKHPQSLLVYCTDDRGSFEIVEPCPDGTPIPPRPMSLSVDFDAAMSDFMQLLQRYWKANLS